MTELVRMLKDLVEKDGYVSSELTKGEIQELLYYADFYDRNKFICNATVNSDKQEQPIEQSLSELQCIPEDKVSINNCENVYVTLYTMKDE